jgi:hypothetical protein
MAESERKANLELWWRDGAVAESRATKRVTTEMSIGRADSKRHLGFIVKQNKVTVDFCLDRSQVAELTRFLTYQIRRLRF